MTKAWLDEDGQPLNRFFNAERVEARTISELLGVINGILADGTVCAKEVEYLGRWVLTYPESASQWPANVLIEHLNRIFADGKIDDEERESLRGILEDIVGAPSHGFTAPVTRLPLTKPTPEVIFDQNTFVLTGKFLYGPRKNCERAVEIRGGRCEDNVTLRTRYLVVGTVGSRDWIQSAWGRKIERAVELSGFGEIYIVSEETWSKYLLGG
jgi:NAD-dependent DNA ligase